MDKFLTCSVGENNVEIELLKGNTFNRTYNKKFLLNNIISYKNLVELFDTYIHIRECYYLGLMKVVINMKKLKQ